jgi:predicted permease
VQPSDDRTGVPTAAVISHTAWQQRFGASPDIAGTVVLLNGLPATIVGVAPEGFYGETLRPRSTEIWIPLSNEPLLQPPARLLEAKSSHWLYVIGRLPPGAALAPVESRLTATLQHWLSTAITVRSEERDRIGRQSITIVPAGSGIGSMRRSVAPALRLLQVIAAVVLLVACANLANLLLARGLTRCTETAVRVALGAPRSRLIAQTLVESAVLACAGGLLGLLVSYAGARAILTIAFNGAATPVNPWPSVQVLAFAFLASLLTALAFGAAPAVVGSRSDPLDALRGGGRAMTDRGSKLRRSLIALQVALSLVLITSAGLLGRSLRNLEVQDFGFRTEGRHVVALASSSLISVPPDELESLYPRLREGLRLIPGVANAAFALYGPMSGDNWSRRIAVVDASSAEPGVASWNRVTPGYFETIGTPILRGRAFDDGDGRGGPPVAIVSETFARRFFGDEDPIGRRIGPPEMTIVGVVADAKYQSGRAPANAMFFVPFLQRPSGSGIEGGSAVRLDRSHYPQALVVQTSRPVPALAAEIRRALAEVDRRVVVQWMMTLEAQVLGHFALDRLTSWLSVAFGSVALLLACLGLYGITSQSVTRRTREVGIRMAVGATGARVLRTVLKDAALQVALGLAIGVPAALGAGWLLQSRLFQVEGWDPSVVAGGLGLLAVCAFAAVIVPARRAATLDPVRALRVE